jgi:hypothetical protein
MALKISKMVEYVAEVEVEVSFEDMVAQLRHTAENTRAMLTGLNNCLCFLKALPNELLATLNEHQLKIITTELSIQQKRISAITLGTELTMNDTQVQQNSPRPTEAIMTNALRTAAMELLANGQFDYCSPYDPRPYIRKLEVAIQESLNHSDDPIPPLSATEIAALAFALCPSAKKEEIIQFIDALKAASVSFLPGVGSLTLPKDGAMSESTVR